MTRSSWALAAAAVGLLFGCAGLGPKEEELARFAAPSPPWLLQRPTGLFDGEGRFVAPLGGDWEAWDLYVIDAGQEHFFLLSDASNTVRVARRDGSDIVVTTLLEGARVVRPVGQVAAITNADGSAPRVIDAEGKVLHEGVTPSEIDVSAPEYWWSPAQTTRAAPFCRVTPAGKADASACGWIDGAGKWLPDEPASDDDLRVTKRAAPVESGNPSYYARAAFDVVGRDGKPRGTADRSVTDEVEQRCTDREGCRYRFHVERAPVWAFPGGQPHAAYLGPDGAFAIGPVPCGTDTLSGPFHDERAFLCEGSGFWMIDRSGKKIAGPYPSWERTEEWDVDEYPAGLFFSDGLAAVPVEGGWGYVDPDGELVIPGPYTAARPFRLGLAKVVLGEEEVRYIRKDATTALEAP